MAEGSVIKPWKVVGGNASHPYHLRLLEDAEETFLAGTPVVVQDSDGMLIESPALSSALTIAGFSAEAGSNLTTEGVAETLTQGSVENQPLAQIIPGGVAPNDGRCGVWIADDKTLFIGVVQTTQTPAQADVGNIFGATKDGTSDLWYIDKDITAAGSGAIFEIIEIPIISGDPLAPATPVAGGKIVFKVTKAGRQYSI
jgi:hypothetical protein